MAFRVEPKLVLTTEGQGRAADPVGLGIPVMIDGPWAEPRIYPDMAGILDNPDAAYAKLKEMGKGLFGPGRRRTGRLGGLAEAAAGSGGRRIVRRQTVGSKLGETLGNLIQQGLGHGRQHAAARNGPGPAPTEPQLPRRRPVRSTGDARRRSRRPEDAQDSPR